MIQKLLKLPKFELRAILDPGLFHQPIILLIQIDRRQLVSSDTMEQATLFVQEHNLEGFQFLGEFARSDIGIDVEDLSALAFGQTGEDGQGTGADGRFDGTFVDLGDLSDESVFVLVEVVGGEDSRGDGASAGAELFEGADEFEVLLEEDTTCDAEGFCV